MLLSMFISFLLARRFRWKTYVALTTIIVALVSLFSVTVVYLYPLPLFDVRVKQYPLPLSFPFHVCIWRYSGYGFRYGVEIYFLTLRIGHQSLWLAPSSMFDIMNFFGKVYISFLLINVVGAIFGYWISKTTFIDKLLTRRKTN
jgi:hypothetical protein